MDERIETSASGLPGCGAAVAGLGGSGTLIAVVLAAVMGLGPLFPFVLIATLAIVGLIGGPAFLLIRKRVTWWRVTIGGFVTGAAVPAYVVLTTNPPDDAAINGINTVTGGSYTHAGLLLNAAYVGAFGIVGVLGAMLAWLFIHHLSPRRDGPQLGPVKSVAAVVMLLAAIAVATTAWIRPWGHEDSSCHNTMRDGRTSISPVAEFRLSVTMSEWVALRDEIDRFAHDNGWDVQADVRPDPGFPWFQVSVCREPGTAIFVTTAAFEQDLMSISVYQPQGGGTWQAPMRELQDRFERRWPGKVGYDYGEYSIPRPPWAPASPVPTDAPLRPRENSL